MSGVAKKLMGTTAAGGGEFTAIEDVFSTYLYTGNGSTQTITNGIDLAGEGGLVWVKPRVTGFHNLYDTARGVNSILYTNTTDPAESKSPPPLVSYDSNGFTLDSYTGGNTSGVNYASWTFRKAPRFFDVVTYTGTGSARTISHNLGVEPGCIIIKSTTNAHAWVVYHRSLGTAQHIALNTTNPPGPDSSGEYWNSTAPTSEEFSLGTYFAVNGVDRDFVAYLYAHDPLGPSGDGSDGLIACGSFTGNGSATGPVVDLGWEPQWLLVKRSDSTGDWNLIDNMRGFTAGGADAELNPNLSAAESTGTFVSPTSTGFQLNTTDAGYNASGGTYVYIAIRRGPMRAPESGTEVFATATRTGTGTAPAVIDVGFPPDMAFNHQRTVTSGEPRVLFGGRILGGGRFETTSTNGYNDSGYPSDYDVREWGQTTLSLGANWVDSGREYVNHVFRRAPSFFDMVAYTGDGVAGRTVPHNLGVAPEMIIIKRRDGDDSNPHWYVYHAATGTGKMLLLNLNEAAAINPAFWGTPSTDEVFDADRNTSGQTYIAYLFATLVGVSKVGSYTGNGSSQTINCGFTTGARLVLIKATSTTGDWLIADTARGIVAGNDPYLELNTTNAEVTSEDWLDPDSGGFIVNEVAGSNANTSGVSYIFYAIA